MCSMGQDFEKNELGAWRSNDLFLHNEASASPKQYRMAVQTS